jgi:hypothetical protein
MKDHHQQQQQQQHRRISSAPVVCFDNIHTTTGLLLQPHQHHNNKRRGGNGGGVEGDDDNDDATNNTKSIIWKGIKKLFATYGDASTTNAPPQDYYNSSSISKGIPTCIEIPQGGGGVATDGGNDGQMSDMMMPDTMDNNNNLSFDTSHPAKWAIAFEQLLEVDALATQMYGNHSYRRKTMRDIHRDIIIPQCQETQQSYALSKNPNGRKIGAFITHCWDEPFKDFCESIKAAFHHFPVKPNLWICAFALMQDNNEQVVTKQLEMPLEESPFVLALREATWFVVVRNSKRDLYSRIWCVCELYFATKFGFTTTTKNKNNYDKREGGGGGGGGGDSRSNELDDNDDGEMNGRNTTMVIGPDVFSDSRTSCVDAEAYHQEDKRRILELLRAEDTVEGVDRLVLQYRKYGTRTSSNSKDIKSFFIIGAIFMLLLVVATFVGILSLIPADGPPLPGDFLNNLPPFTLDEISQDESSPQSRAYMWLLFHPQYHVQEEWHQKQLFALAAFYFAFDGDKRDDDKRDSWLSKDIPECKWASNATTSIGSIVCNEDNKIKELRLDSQGAAGRTPLEVSFLSSLKRFEIRNLRLYAPLAQLVPSKLSSLPDLTDLILPGNFITGSLPSYLGEFHRLTDLNLQDNEIAGTIPSEIGLMTNLERLSFAQNELSGSVPTEFGALSSLNSLSIEHNRIVGALPTVICAIQSLSAFWVDCLKITCSEGCSCLCPGDSEKPLTIPVPPNTSSTVLSGATVPPNDTLAPTGDATVPSVSPTVIPGQGREDTQNTTAPIPSASPVEPPVPSPPEELGLTPYPSSAPGQYMLVLPGYSVTAITRDAASPQSRAYDWLIGHPDLDMMLEWRKQQLFALATFFYAFGGEGWSVYENQHWLNYTVDECMWGHSAGSTTGTTTTSSDNQSDICDANGRIVELTIKSTQAFNGPALPPEIGLLRSLHALKLYFLKDFVAELSNVLPIQLAYLSRLQTLFVYETQVYGSIPISQLSSFRSLINLDLRNNQLNGTLPTELGLMSKLQFMTLYGNSRLGGTIPSQLGMLTSLESLLLDRTQITGAVPEELCSLPSLYLRVNCSMIKNCTASCASCSCYTETE